MCVDKLFPILQMADNYSIDDETLIDIMSKIDNDEVSMLWE